MIRTSSTVSNTRLDIARRIDKQRDWELMLLPHTEAWNFKFCKATPFRLVGESKESLNRRETDRDLRSAL